jgi:hypothetical protein
VPRAPGIGLQGLPQHFVERRELARLLAAPVLRRAIDLAVQPLRDRVARQPRDARNLAHRLLLAAMQPPILPIMSMVITPRPLLHKKTAG